MHTLNNCYDSHIHWQATGDIATRLKLDQIKSPEDLKQLKVESHHWQSDWLLGFGWDENLWKEGQKPHRSLLDQIWPNQPVCFSRADGHAFWVNSEVLTRLGWREGQKLPSPNGGEVVLDGQGQPSGVFVDRAKAPIEALLPELSDQQICAYLLKGLQIFNRAGFTHLRDLGGEERHWQEACRLDQSGLLTAAIEQFFFVNDPENYNQEKTVTRSSGDYNVDTDNYKITATREANNATSEYNTVVFIAHVAPIINITIVNDPARLRSGGNDGTTAQNYNIRIESDQRLVEGPSLDASIGEWQDFWSSSSNNTVWTRVIQIHDDMGKGDGEFTDLVATGLSGLQQNSINSGADYTVGGFVEREIPLAAFAHAALMNVAVSDYNKLEIEWEVVELPYKRDVGTTERPDVGAWSIDATGENPTTIIILDSAATDSSSQETIITIEEIE